VVLVAATVRVGGTEAVIEDNLEITTGDAGVRRALVAVVEKFRLSPFYIPNPPLSVALMAIEDLGAELVELVGYDPADRDRSDVQY
jgi:hypothetical protein